MFLDDAAAQCSCRICRLPRTIRQRTVDALFRDILLTAYGADITRVWKRERA